jgi:galactokinase
VKSTFPTRTEIFERTAARFEAEYGTRPATVGLAPGRVNLIGEHTDYCGGFVLPAAIPMCTAVAVGPGTDGMLRIVSTLLGRAERPAAGLAPTGRFDDYLAGAVKLAGFEGRPLNVLVHGNLPPQAGLSSSASLLVAAAAALRRRDAPTARPPSPKAPAWLAPPLRGEAEGIELAMLARRVENEFVGVPCGFMDQFAVACGQEGRALLLDCLDNRFVEVPARVEGYEWLVVFSGLRRELAGGGYKSMVTGLKEAVETVVARTGIDRQFTRWFEEDSAEALAAEAKLGAQQTSLLLHLCSENRRVHAMRFALERQDPQAIGWLLAQGHDSLSRQFGVSTPKLDALVEFAAQLDGMAGMRLTGAGMGGSLVALVRRDGAEEAMQRLEAFLKREVSADGELYPIPGFVQGVETWRP